MLQDICNLTWTWGGKNLDAENRSKRDSGMGIFMVSYPPGLPTVRSV